jgi:integrase
LVDPNRWIRPRWGDYLLEQPVEVEEWLRLLALAPKTKVNLRSLFHLIYEHARRWELTDCNPIDLVRQPSRHTTRARTRRNPRPSGAAGRAIPLRRGVVNGKAGDTKTEASRKALPVDPRLAELLQKLQERSLHAGPQDWVFANRAGRPRGQQNILQRYLRPAAVRSAIGKIGWHTFRHSYSTMLGAAGAGMKVQQELLRHSTIQSTMNICTQAVFEQKRAANSMVVGILFNRIASKNQPPANGS